MNLSKKIIIRVIIIVLILTPFIFIQGGKLICKHRVTTYLIEEKGYVREEIKLIKVQWGNYQGSLVE